MSDILSTYYKSNYAIKNNVYKKRNYYTPNKIVKIDTDRTMKNLSQYGFYLSENNFILLPKKKFLPRLTLNGIEPNQIKDYLSKTNFSKNESNKDNKDIKPIKINYKTENNFLNNKNDVKKSDDYTKLKKELEDIRDNKDKNIKTIDLSQKKPKKNKPLKIKLLNNKYICYTEDKNERLDNEKKAEQITNELLSLKTYEDIKSYYIKKELKKKKSVEKDIMKIFSEDSHTIDPLSYIKYNLITNPKRGDLFKSFDIQLMIMGNEKYRNNLLDGVNDYKKNLMQYEELRGPTGFDKNRIEEKERNKIINQMKKNYVEKRGMIFTQQTFKPKPKNKKRTLDFEYDENYKHVKKLLNKDMQKYEKHINKNLSKKRLIKIDKSDINTMSKLDDDADVAIKGVDDMVKFSNQFLSFDEKLKRLVSKTTNTTGYLFKRTKEYQKIKTKIDQFYNIEY
jgi:hypothetical protein